jgi:hypothetical protein
VISNTHSSPTIRPHLDALSSSATYAALLFQAIRMTLGGMRWVPEVPDDVELQCFELRGHGTEERGVLAMGRRVNPSLDEGTMLLT